MTQSILSLADALSGDPKAAADTAAAKKSSGLTKLLSLLPGKK